MPIMNDLDALLRESNPAPTMPDTWVALASDLASSKVRRHPRRRLAVIIAGVVGGTLLVGGGVATAAAQGGWLGADRYVDGPDMTGVLHVKVKDGTRFDCTYTLHAGADYQQPASYQRITDGIAEAHRYMRTLDPASIKTDPSLVDPYAVFGPPDGSLDDHQARAQLQAFISTVAAKVNSTNAIEVSERRHGSHHGLRSGSDQMTSVDRLAELSNRLAPRLLGYFIRRVEPREDAADLLAQTLTVAWRRLRSMPDDPAEADAWAFTIAANVLSNHRRSAVRRDRLALKLRDELRQPDDEFETVDLRTDVATALARLPEEQSELVRLVYWDGLSATAAGQVLGMPGSTARLKLRAARDELAAVLGVPVA